VGRKSGEDLGLLRGWHLEVFEAATELGRLAGRSSAPNFTWASDLRYLRPYDDGRVEIGGRTEMVKTREVPG